MNELVVDIIIFAYACTAVIATVGYIPTIKDLWLHKKKSANITSYVIWTVSSAISFLYAFFILPDLLFQIVSGLGFFSCAVILVLSLVLKYRKILIK